jgi:hypothetical protein
MATEVMIRVSGGRLSPLTAADDELLGDLEGGDYRAVLTQPKGQRSLSQLGLWWKLCEIIADNFAGEDLDKESVSDVLKIECGHAKVWRDGKGSYRRSPKSIAFNKMPPELFGSW